MKVMIAGTPLESMVWQRDIHRVRLIFRPDTDLMTEQRFLVELQETIKERIKVNARRLQEQICEENLFY